MEKPQDIAIMKKIQTELPWLKKEAENAEFWIGYAEKDCLVQASAVVEKFDSLADLCVFQQERIIPLGNERQEGAEEDEEFEQVANTSELCVEWDYHDYRIIDDDEQPDVENQRLLRNMRAHEIGMIIVKHRSLKEAD